MAQARNPVVALNNLLQPHGQLHLLKWSERSSGPPNAPTWTVECKFSDQVIGYGSAGTKGLAKEAAAEQALEYLKSVQPSYKG